MNEDLQFYTELYVDQGYSYEEAELMARKILEEVLKKSAINLVNELSGKMTERFIEKLTGNK